MKTIEVDWKGTVATRSRMVDTPWKLGNAFWAALVYPRIRLLFAWNQIPWGPSWRFFGVPVIQKHRRSQMRFGRGLQLRSSVCSNPLGPNHPVILCTWRPGTILEIGNDFGMTGGSICCAERITIGSHVVVGANSIITDTDFHPLDPRLRRLGDEGTKTSPVVIADDVFIGMNCLVLKGVTIGQCSVVGAGSVVTHDVAPYTIVSGNPARAVRTISST